MKSQIKTLLEKITNSFVINGVDKSQIFGHVRSKNVVLTFGFL